MISTNDILKQLEQHIQLAKQSTSNVEIRDHFVAIKTLSEMYLNSSGTASTKQAPLKQTAQIQTSSFVSSATKISEDDANGDSIFDF